MRTPDAIASPDEARPSPAAPDFLREWERVRVDRVELERAAPPSTLARVQACLFLGRLLPVDVEVELAIDAGDAGSAGDGAASRTVVEWMWSEHSYQNGSFLFEAHLPDDRLFGARHAAIHVRPRDWGHDAGAIVAILPAVELHQPPGDEPARGTDATRAPATDETAPVLPWTSDDLGP